MIKNGLLAGVFIVTGLLFAAPPSFAQNPVAREIIWFNTAKVGLSESAVKCNLTDPTMFAAVLSQRLQAIGIARNPNSRLVATLSVAAQTFGLFSGQCAYNVTLQFQSFLNATEINTPDPRVRAALARLGHLPLSIYQDGIFGVVVLSGPSNAPDSAQKKVKEAIAVLVDRLRTARGR